jgi:hypothetical protein
MMRDKLLSDNQRNLENEKVVYKGKMQDIEARNKELETKRSSMIFDHEKEKAKWGLEKDHIINQKQEIQE